MHKLEISTVNTEGDVKRALEFFTGREEELVISISSGDHVSRIQRLWVRHINQDVDFIPATIGCREFYAESGLEPFILEGASHADFIPVFNQIWDIPAENREKAAQEIEEVIQKYSD